MLYRGRSLRARARACRIELCVGSWQRVPCALHIAKVTMRLNPGKHSMFEF